MASVISKVGLMLFGLVMMALGGLFALVFILFQILRHPFTAFKKVARNGEPILLTRSCKQ